MKEYDQIADWYVEMRCPDVGIRDVADIARRLPSGARILDLGCGDGIPISRFLIRHGFDLVALDSSPEMISRYWANFPSVPARCQRAEEADFSRESFAAVVAWGVLFHLSEAAQRALIRGIAGWLKPGGRFLFTSGKESGIRHGEMDGVAFQYTSLGVNGYRKALERAGLNVKASGPDERDNYVYVAAKAASR